MIIFKHTAEVGSVSQGDPIAHAVSMLEYDKYSMYTEKIHPTWGLKIQTENIEELFQQPDNFWKDTLYKNKLIVISNVNFTNHQFGLFANLLGNNPSMHLFSNKIHKVLGQQAMEWHADLPNNNNRAKVAFKGGPFPIRCLWLKSNPNPAAGITGFVNIADSMDLLSPELKDLIPRVTVTQQGWGDETFSPGGNGVFVPGTHTQQYDFVKIHPITKEKSLRVNHHNKNGISDGWICDVKIDGVSQRDCRLIQQYLDAILEHPDMVYYHYWNVNDLVICDNWSLLHNRSSLNLKENEERLMVRVDIDHAIN
jgi:hypothetical protein